MMSHKINIVVPMAGAGSRFAIAGYKAPKPFIDVKGKMMIERVLDNLSYPGANFILIAREEHLVNCSEAIEDIQSRFPVSFILINALTHGAACTVLAAHRLINSDTPLLIANSDQIVDMNLSDYIEDCFSRKLDGSILTFHDTDTKWSYAKVDKGGHVLEVKEKQVISNHATVGIYLFASGRDFIDGTLDMISKRDTTNDEFYIAPVYNHLIKQDKNIGLYEINKEDMHGIGTPDDLTKYLEILL
jgi:UDP-N-acetylglucosamine diphosphorylase / glucose-1-phosphate thymidylyltransferase / UDP-N-acetylgalactosamine diphosphorylase / glucosamine-1-phosphate N-acetyltransferase / galactosamine-1-phosphate N-acetyltransferase